MNAFLYGEMCPLYCTNICGMPKKKERVLINDLRDIYVILSYCEIEGSYTVKYREVEFEEDKLSIYVSY